MGDFTGREALRSTWLQDDCTTIDRDVRFLVCGAPGKHEFPPEALEEKDLVIIHCIEGVRWDGLKTLAMFQWAYHHRKDADWIFKMDTDTFPYWPKLVETLYDD